MKNESEAIEAAIRMLKSEFSVSKVILFGSKARGNHDEHSDIDLLMHYQRYFPHLNGHNIQDFLKTLT